MLVLILFLHLVNTIRHDFAYRITHVCPEKVSSLPYNSTYHPGHVSVLDFTSETVLKSESRWVGLELHVSKVSSTAMLNWFICRFIWSKSTRYRHLRLAVREHYGLIHFDRSTFIMEWDDQTLLRSHQELTFVSALFWQWVVAIDFPLPLGSQFFFFCIRIGFQHL